MVEFPKSGHICPLFVTIGTIVCMYVLLLTLPVLAKYLQSNGVHSGTHILKDVSSVDTINLLYVFLWTRVLKDTSYYITPHN